MEALPDDVLSYIGKFINVKKQSLRERNAKISQKLQYYIELPDSYYLQKAELFGYKETPKCYKKDGKLYKKSNPEHIKIIRRMVYCEIVDKGMRFQLYLDDEWCDLYQPIAESPIPLPNVTYERIGGEKVIYNYVPRKIWIYEDGTGWREQVEGWDRIRIKSH
jgi:hypothetical protein